MLTTKQKKIILYLAEQTLPCTASELAKQLDISTQSVKLYVKEINSLSKDKIILSSNRGYTIIKQKYKDLLENCSDIPQNYDDRSIYIIKKTLINHQTIDVFEACDELLISYSTLKSDLAKMNATFQRFHIHFSTHNNLIQIEGTENDKRALLSSIISQETTDNILDLNTLKKVFHSEDIEKTSKIINDFFKKDPYNLNNFSYINILLHLSILIERVKKGNSLSEYKEIISINGNERELIQNISKRIENDFNISLNAFERNEIYILFKTKVNYSTNLKSKEIQRIIGPDYLNTTHKIIEEISDLFSINLNHDSFVIPFSLHIKSLITRATLKRYIKNPLSERIKEDYPILYDIAIFISLKLCEIYQIEINNDEIAFIFLHIGTEIDRQNTNSERIRCILLSPDYLNINQKISDFLIHEFPNEIILETTCSSYEELNHYNFDLLITLSQDNRNHNFNHVIISPLQLERHKNEIHEKIYEIQQKRKKDLIISNFDNFFDSNLFFTIENMSRDEIIHFMCEKMLSLNFVTTSFEQNVFQRENAAPTSFENIAIPHSILMDAIETKIGIAVSKNGISWGNHTVYVILLIAINQLDRKIFYTLNEYILSLFDNPIIFAQMKKANSLNEFKKICLL